MAPTTCEAEHMMELIEETPGDRRRTVLRMRNSAQRTKPGRKTFHDSEGARTPHRILVSDRTDPNLGDSRNTVKRRTRFDSNFRNMEPSTRLTPGRGRSDRPLTSRSNNYFGNSGMRYLEENRVRPSKAVAIVIKSTKDNASYAEILRRAKDKIALPDCGIDYLNIREANGGLIMEVPGSDSREKADRFADKLKLVLGDEVRVTHPLKMANIRLTGLEVASGTDEICRIISSDGRCLPSEVRIRKLQRSINGTWSVWVCCPVTTVQELSTRGKIIIGWATVKIDPLRYKPTQCFKCWNFGHVVHVRLTLIDLDGALDARPTT